MTLLAINWANAGTQAAYLLMSLSILVILHEFGHYLPAKLFGCRIEKFFLFFDPWFAIVKKKIGETVYGIGWLPLGGYVKISGMVDESMDKEQLKQPAQPWEFRSKPAWQRLIIMLGGVTVILLLAFLIYAMILFVWGEQKIPNVSVKNGISIIDSLMYDMGLKDGDKILAVNDKRIPYYDDIPKRLLVGERVTIERDGKEQNLNIPVNLLGSLSEKKRSKTPLFVPRVPVIVDFVPDTSNAKKAGLQKMDKIIAVDSFSTTYFDQFRTIMNAKKGSAVRLTVERNNQQVNLSASVSKEGTLGFVRYLAVEDLDSLGFLKIEKKKYGFFEAFPAGVRLALDNLQFYIDQFKKILSPKTGAYKGIGGFKAMGSVMPQQWGDWQAFWSITAFLSIILAFMNLLPIPALDGGHVLFTLIEMVSGRKPSDTFLEYAQVVGMVLLLGLMLYANGNDWFGW
ncbi:MAG: RIP metalloprotease RseP, partial [Bacteroidota bacterium]